MIDHKTYVKMTQAYWRRRNYSKESVFEQFDKVNFLLNHPDCVNGSVLDFGCGYGQVAPILRSVAKSVAVWDAQPFMRQQAYKLLGTDYAHIEEPDIYSSTWNLVFMCSVLTLIDNPIQWFSAWTQRVNAQYFCTIHVDAQSHLHRSVPECWRSDQKVVNEAKIDYEQLIFACPHLRLVHQARWPWRASRPANEVGWYRRGLLFEKIF